VSIPQTIKDGETLTIRVTNPEDPTFGVIKGESTITVKR